MILSLVTGYVGMATVALLVTVVAFFILRKKLPPKLWLFLFIPGALAAGLIRAASFDVIVVEKECAIRRYLVIGHPVFVTPDGQNVEIKTRKHNDIYIINTTSTALALEHLEYAKNGDSRFPLPFGLRPTILPPHRAMACTNIPDLYPNEAAPDSVIVMENIERDSRVWLRRATMEEAEDDSEYGLVPPVYSGTDVMDWGGE